MCGGWRTLCHTRWTRGRDAERSQPTPKGQKDGCREIPLPRGPRRSRIRGDRARNGGGAGADRGGCRWGRRRPQGPGDEGRTAADELEISRCVRSPQPANKGDRGRYRSDLTAGRSGTSCPLSFCFSQRATLGMSQGSCWEVWGWGVQMSLEATKQMLVSIRGGRPERSRSVPRIHVRLVSRVSGETGRLSCVISGVWWGHLSKNKRKEDTRVFQKR